MKNAIEVDLDLVKKYNVPAPRYTSYPTALQFRDDVGDDAIFNIMREDIAAGGNVISIYIHIPFCKSLCWYCGCTTVPARSDSDAERYLDSLEKEIELWKNRIAPDGTTLSVAQLHFGGGTPSALTPRQIDRIAAMLRKHFLFTPDAEISVELDPRSLTREIVDAFRRLGCSRASLGVQDLNPKVQVAIHRVQPKPLIEQAVRWLRECGFSSINFDLIYGLPFQTTDSYEQTLAELLELRPDRFAVFSYAHVPWLKPQQKLLEQSGALPSPDEKIALLKTIIEKLTHNGFVYIGLDHFAREDDELVHALRERRLQRNFQGYSTHAGLPIVALGMSSISQSARSFSQNEKTLEAYENRVDSGNIPRTKGLILTEEDLRRREIITRIMCDLELDYLKLSAQFGFDFKTRYSSEIAKLDSLADDGLIALREDGNGFSVTHIGRMFIRNIALPFDAYFQAGAQNRHSKAV